ERVPDRKTFLRCRADDQGHNAAYPKRRLFGQVRLTSARAFPKEVIDPNLGPSYRNTIIGIVFNAGIIKPADAPKSLEDLVKPQYKGKVVVPDASQHTTTAQWLASLHKVMGSKEKADKFIRDLAAAKPLRVESLTPAG